jgi:hypothetical protein
MTFSKTIFQKPLLILPILLAIGFMFAAPMILDAAAAKGSNGNGNNNGGNDETTIPTNALLPDVSPGVPKHLNIHNQQQKEFLRFTNVWANLGPGTLEFEPLFPDPDADEGTTQDAFQNLYDDEGNFGLTDQNVWHENVSQFIFHEAHNHWHIDNVGEFAVRAYDPNNPDVPGDIVDDAASIKVGFCITNVFKYNGEESPTSQRIYWDCEVGLQGIQPGWVDQYHQSVEGNEINITKVPNGTYFLTHTWNPANAFVDADNSNNVSWMKFELTDDGNGNRKINEIEGFAPECQDDDSTPGICGDINKNS